jgi:hypothetical protein
VGYVGYFLGRLIQSAVSRQRELLGDAAAVQFTRNPLGLAGALKKVGGLAEGARLDHPRAAELCHMYFGNGLPEAWLRALDSHPPLAQRILRLDPAFDGVLPVVRGLEAPQAPLPPRRQRPAEAATVVSGAEVAALLESVGAPLREHAELVRRLLAELPATLRQAARDPDGAAALVCALLLDRDPAVRTAQEAALAGPRAAAALAAVRPLASSLVGLDPRARLLLADLALPALRRLDADLYRLLKQTAARLTEADGRVSPFELALRHLLLRHLEPHFSGRPEKVAQIYAIRGVERPCSVVLSALARAGHPDEAQARLGFARGELVLHEPRAEFAFLAAADCGPAAFDRALAALDGASPPIKRRLLAACLECLAHDGRVTPAEVELFRAVADALGCPVPPWAAVVPSQAVPPPP